MNTQLLGEQKSGLISAVFSSENQAKSAIVSLVDSGHIDARYIDLVEPHDQNLQKKLEPETQGIGRTLLRSHLKLGLVGVATGFFLGLALVLLDLSLFQGNEVIAIVSISTFGAFIGLLIAGLISLRPDHDPVIEKTRRAADQGDWAVVVHTDNLNEKRRAQQAMEAYAKSVSQSF